MSAEYQSASSSSSIKINKNLLSEGEEENLPKEKEPQDLSKSVDKYEKSNQTLQKLKNFEEPSSSSKDIINREGEDKEKIDSKKVNTEEKFIEETLKTKNLNMLSNPIENHYSREQDLRYTSLSDVSRSISSYAIDSVTANRLAMQEYDVQAVHSTNHRPYDSSSLMNSQTAFERYDPNYSLQRTSMYSPYCQPTLEELANQQKYLLEQQQQQQQQHPPLMKTEPDDSNNGPVYPRPIYHSYDPTGKFFLISFIMTHYAAMKGKKMRTNLFILIIFNSSSLQSLIEFTISDVDNNNRIYCNKRCFRNHRRPYKWNNIKRPNN